MVREVRRLQRTSYFPGLGWLLTRDLFVNELEGVWPEIGWAGWDHWLREPARSKGRDCVTPQIPRCVYFTFF